MFFIHLLLLGLPLCLVQAIPLREARDSAAAVSGYWVANIKRQGTAAFGNNTGYNLFRNVKDFGAKGDGSTDDTNAINQAISSGDRCGYGCDSSTTTPALVYFPPGTYVVSKPIIQYYYTQMVGDALNPPVLKAASSFSGMAVIDSDPYTDSGDNWYTNQNNFFRAIRNFVIDLTAMPQSSGAGIHWQVAQATSLQNIRFEMVKGGGDANKQIGVFMDNGSGGFMSDLTFNGGNYGMFVGNQQFTTRNLTFNNCNTAVFMNWNWAWTFKSVDINNCGVGLNMSNSPQNQTVGSVMLLDAKLTNTPTGIVTAYSTNNVPVSGGTLVLDNVDFTGSKVAIASIQGNTILHGGSVVSNWVQGHAYTSSNAQKKRSEDSETRVVQRVEVVKVIGSSCPVPSGATGPASAAQSVSSPSPAEASTERSAPSLASTGSSVPTGMSTQKSSLSLTPGTPSSLTPSSSETVRPMASTETSASPSNTPSTCASKPITNTRLQGTVAAQKLPGVLLDGGDKIFERSKPLYEDYPASAFVSVKSAGAKGDGVTDDTEAIQKVLDSVTQDQIVYFDHGAYIITSTLKVPKNIKITGEVWPLLMASGSAFADESNPIPMLQIGQTGDSGSVELSDLMLETKGPAPGAILMEWNLAQSSQGSAGMWDVHFRVGGSAGTELQSDTCKKDPKKTNTPNPKCIGAFMLLHITEKASVYLENIWAWTADHELDLQDHSQIDIYTGRGIFVESKGPVWLYGTSSEHNQLYNYQVANAQNVFMGFIQSETPYYQSNPNAMVPFTPQKEAWNDPDFSACTTNACKKSWGLRVLESSDVYIYGAGLYSFFDNYSQTCLDTESCQENMVEVDCSDVKIYGLSTKASMNMVTSSEGKSLVLQSDNESNFCATIGLFQQ